jgi:hypothetical protein
MPLRVGCLALAGAIVALAAQTGFAAAAGASVERACADDYFAYCSKHDPDSPGVRSCMRANGSKLSQRCVNALVAAGEVSKSELERRTARK